MQYHWSEMDQKFWINHNDEVLWFESVLDLKDAIRRIEIEEAMSAEVQKIAGWFRKHGMEQTAQAVETGAYRND